MKGRILVWPLVIALALALLAQTDRWRDRMLASRLLRQVEILSNQAIAAGRAPRGLMASNLEALRRAAALDPVEIGIPIARGSQFLLLGSPQSAIDSYREAERLEPRPETHMNLGRALLMTGEVEEARRQFALGVRLDPRLAAEVPAAAR
ncbi:MAG TPA: hypothetical protein VMW27_10025 [Thermoanaerobaculia bacterium]|nr:hypothetical protein [Thermoanaerobaculia bacterium]